VIQRPEEVEAARMIKQGIAERPRSRSKQCIKEWPSNGRERNEADQRSRSGTGGSQRPEKVEARIMQGITESPRSRSKSASKNGRTEGRRRSDGKKADQAGGGELQVSCREPQSVREAEATVHQRMAERNGIRT
jgi:hypothetical protein